MGKYDVENRRVPVVVVAFKREWKVELPMYIVAAWLAGWLPARSPLLHGRGACSAKIHRRPQLWNDACWLQIQCPAPEKPIRCCCCCPAGSPIRWETTPGEKRNRGSRTWKKSSCDNAQQRTLVSVSVLWSPISAIIIQIPCWSCCCNCCWCWCYRGQVNGRILPVENALGAWCLMWWYWVSPAVLLLLVVFRLFLRWLLLLRLLRRPPAEQRQAQIVVMVILVHFFTSQTSERLFRFLSFCARVQKSTPISIKKSKTHVLTHVMLIKIIDINICLGNNLKKRTIS